MDSKAFKITLKKLGITQAKAASMLNVTEGNMRVTLSRLAVTGEQVPENWARLVTLSPDVTKENVTSVECNIPSVTIPWPSDSAYDILDDGWARGYPGDTNLMRCNYRTPAACLRRAGYQT